MKRKISLSMQYWGIHKNFSTRSYVSIWEEKLDTSSNVFFIKARKKCLIKNVMCLNWLQFYWALASHITKRKSMGKKASCLQQSFLISISRIQNNSPALNMKIFQGFSKTKKNTWIKWKAALGGRMRFLCYCSGRSNSARKRVIGLVGVPKMIDGALVPEK